MSKNPLIAIVIPCFKVRRHILDVLQSIGPEVTYIFVIDDCCPEHSGEHVSMSCSDTRVRVISNPENLGVGGAVMVGYKASMAVGADVIVKLDGDGQMDPSLIPYFVNPIISGEADYTKGNRFFDLERIGAMPPIRLFGNTVLSFLTKLSSGYWDIYDPTNGFTAIHADVAKHLPFNKIDHRYFFETDMLFRLNILRAMVVDVPMDAKYGEEVSNLVISKTVSRFLVGHTRNFLKRIFYNYYLRDLSLASIELPLGLILLIFGVSFGAYHWWSSAQAGVQTAAGTVMLSALPILTGLQFVMAFLAYDIAAIPRRALHRTSFVFARRPASPERES